MGATRAGLRLVRQSHHPEARRARARVHGLRPSQLPRASRPQSSSQWSADRRIPWLGTTFPPGSSACLTGFVDGRALEVCVAPRSSRRRHRGEEPELFRQPALDISALADGRFHRRVRVGRYRRRPVRDRRGLDGLPRTAFLLPDPITVAGNHHLGSLQVQAESEDGLKTPAAFRRAPLPVEPYDGRPLP